MLSERASHERQDSPVTTPSELAALVRARSLPGTDEVPLVRTRDFSVFFGAMEVLRSINLQIPQGAITAIIGPSGCGKSTFLSAVNRMTDLIPDCRITGQLFFRDTNVYAPDTDPVWLRRQIGMVFQKPNPFPKSIFKNVAYAPRLHGVRGYQRLSEIAERSLRETGLWEEVKDRLHQNALGLSGGQQQRLCIARAIAVGPELLLLDEPTSALDPASTARIEELLNQLRGRYTVVIVTHNMQQAARVSDYVAFLYNGNLVEFGRTSQLFTKPRQRDTENYITGRFS
jgi:phosphate transport system ATP-binding protein